MVYLDNTIEQQTVWIPRNDGLGSTHKGSYDQGFEDGYVSGETHQKNLLSSTAFTENGEYERENGWSAVTVNVPQTGSTAKLEEKSVTISADTTYVLPSSGYDGMSAVTIDAEQYGQDNYDSGFDDGYTDGYSSGSSEGYESGYTSGHTDGVNEEKAKLSATTFTANTAVTISDGGYSAITVNVPQTGTSIPLSSITITENTAITETEKAYSAITVNVPQTGHTDQELEDAYESGHTEGMEDQKALLSSTAFTENGSYTSENGWSGVTVSIDTASTYNSGYTSGYTSGHTDGVSEEKEKMSAVTFTANTAVTLSDGSYSAVTVNVPQTGSSINVEANKPYTATTNGTYTITPSSGSVIVNDRFDSDLDRYYLSAITENFPSTGYFEILRIEDEFDSSKGWIDVYLEDGFLDYDETEWNGGEVVDLSGNRDVYLYIENANSDFGWTRRKDFNYHYEAMSAVTLNVNVPLSVSKYVEYIETDGSEIMFDLDTMLTSTAETVYFDFMPLSGVGQYDGWYSFVDSGNFGLRTIVGGYRPNGKYAYKFGNYDKFNGWYNGPGFSAGTKYECEFTITGATINDTFYQYQPSPMLIGTPSNIHLNGWVGNGNISRCPIARYYGFKIMSGNTVVSDFRPCLDANNVPCFYEEVSQTYIYASGSGTPISGPVINTFDYVSGYTDGYASGYASGYTDGYASGYTSGYTSGFTDGYASGSSVGYFGGVESSVYGAYYPIESVGPGPSYINRSYKTQVTTFSGAGVTFEFDFTNLGDASSPYGMFINGYGNNFYLQYDSTESADTKIFRMHIDDGNGNVGTMALYSKGSQRILGYVTINQESCEYGLGVGGTITSTGSTSGNFESVLYSILFNPEFKSNVILNSIRIFVNGTIQKAFCYQNGEIVDVLNNTTSPSYDYDGNVAVGGLQPRLVTYPNKVLNQE